MHPLSRLAAAASLTFCLALAACSTAGTPVHHRPSPAATTPVAMRSDAIAQDWPAYHLNAARTGDAAGLPPAGPLAIAWHATLDGAVYGQPLAVGGLVVAATEGGSVYGLSAATGHIRWRAHIGTPVPLASLPCGDIDPVGITSTPVYDPASGLVYALAETTGFHHVLAGIDITTGHVSFRRDIATPDGQPRYDQQRPALTVDDGRVYVGFGGFAGDCGPYRGSVVGVPVSGTGALVSYMTPTPREGAVWEPGGPVVGPDGTLYVETGNGARTAPPYDGSDSVVALSPALHRLGIFAPSTWAADNAGDLDLGSSSVALFPNGRLLTAGKRGTGYLLDVHHLTGIGSQLFQAPLCQSYGGMSMAGSVAYVPCASGGMAAVAVSGNRFRVLWRGPANAAGSPVLGGGAVWVDDYSNGILYELDPATGRVREHRSMGGACPHFTSPSLYGSLVLVGTMSGVVAVHGA